MAHALLSPSKADRWMACTPSARLEETLPDKPSSYADEGSAAHELARVINTYNTAGSATKKVKTQYETDLVNAKSSSYYNAEMQQYVEAFTQYVWETYNAARAVSKDAKIEIEAELDFHEYVPEGHGIGDVVVICDGQLTIIDLKYGQGVPVDAENNKQMMLYALGALAAYDMYYGVNTVKMVIYQPRIENISEWEIAAKELIRWAGTELKERAALAYDGAGEYVPGGHCQFCKARATCRARSEENLKLAQYDFKPSNLLSEDEIADILKIGDKLVNWYGDIAAHALDRAVNAGTVYPGWKLVEGRSVRTITEPETVIRLLTDADYGQEQICNIKLKGIGDLEKLLGKTFNEFIGPYVIKPQGKPTLVLESDKRPTWNSANAAADEFPDITDEQSN